MYGIWRHIPRCGEDVGGGLNNVDGQDHHDDNIYRNSIHSQHLSE